MKNLINLKNVATIVACFAVVILLTVSCKKENDNNNPNNDYVDDRVVLEKTDSEILSGTVELEGTIKVEISDGVFSTKQKVTVSKITSVAIMKTFDVMADFHDVADCLPYFVSVVCQTLPNSEEIFVTFAVPSDFAQSIPNDHTLNVFVQNYSDAGQELLDYFEPLDANYDNANKTVSVKLPRFAFSNELNQKQYEAIITLAATPIYSRSAITSGIEIMYPLNKLVVTSKFGYRTDPISGVPGAYHNGIDFGVPIGGNIFSVDDGVIQTIGKDEKIVNGKLRGAGIYVIVKHNDGSKASYCHLSSTTPIKQGQRVSTGQLIAMSGNSGGSTGPHLHFVYKNSGGATIDPWPFMIDRIESATVQYRLPDGGIMEFSFTNNGLQWRQETEDAIIVCNGSTCICTDKETGESAVMPAGSENLRQGWMLDPTFPALTSNEMWSYLPGGTQVAEKIAGEWCVAYKALGGVHGLWKNTVYVRVGAEEEYVEAISITRGAHKSLKSL